METMKIEFHEITMADKAWMDEMYAQDHLYACEYTFANNFVWRAYYRAQVAKLCGCLVLRYQIHGEEWYACPAGGGDKKAVIELLRAECRKQGKRLSIAPLDEEWRRQMLDWFPGQFLIEADRDDFDYIYDREKLATLSGKKMHGKRNHIARFQDGGDWSYEPMTEDNLEECRTMTYQWIRMREEKWNGAMDEEILVLHEAFDHMEELGLVGGVLRREGEIVAFTMGEPMNEEMFVVHFEKAFPDMQGAYPMINRQFVLHACEGYRYINREEDAGDPGLRKAKLSYYPEWLFRKYAAVESDVVFADRTRDGGQIQTIWQTCFGDDESYVRFYLEHRMTEDNMLVIWQDGKIVSMASFLPVQYFLDGDYRDARYVYAVATLPAYRKKGLAGRILAFAQQKYRMPLLLAPAEEPLMRYYEKQGFRRAFSASMPEVSDAGEEVSAMELAAAMEPVDAQTYVQLRDDRYQGEGYVRWDETAVQYAIGLSAKCGGGAFLLTQREKRDILMYEVSGDTLDVWETSLTREELRGIARQLLAETGTRRLRSGRMAGMVWLPEAMAHAKLPADGYLALTLG